MFRALGIGIALYVVYAVFNGSVHAKSGIRMREVLRDESPGYFWAVIAIYSVLSLMLIFVF